MEDQIAADSRALLRLNPVKNPYKQNAFENVGIVLEAMNPIINGQYAWLGGVGFEDLDKVVLKLRTQILKEHDFDPGEKGTFDALRARCLDNAFDPLLDYLDSLQWDRKSSLDTWLIDLCAV